MYSPTLFGLTGLVAKKNVNHLSDFILISAVLQIKDTCVQRPAWRILTAT